MPWMVRKETMKRIGTAQRHTLCICIIALILTVFSGCETRFGEQGRASGPDLSFENISFRDIPGITSEEIAAESHFTSEKDSQN